MKLEKALKEAAKDRMAFYRTGNPELYFYLIQGRAYVCAEHHLGNPLMVARFSPDDVMAEDWELTTP